MTEKQSSRHYIQTLLERTNGLIKLDDAQEAFGMPRQQTSRLLYRLTKNGWIKKLKSGLYRVVPLEASNPSLTDENPWLIASQLFSPCYIGCWTAANFWGLTDQLFLDTWVVTAQKVFVKKRLVADHSFILRQVHEDHLFGLKNEWIENNKVLISDPHKTVLDFLCFPEAFSSQSMIEIVKSYLGSKEKNIDLLTAYLKNIKNRSVLKRLGFLMEHLEPNAHELIKYCLENKSKGNSPLSSVSSHDKIISRWNLIIPNSLKEKI